MIHRRWFLVSIRVFIGLPLAAALAAIVALLVTGVTIDVSRWRDASAERVSTALGRTVTLEGPFELSLGRAAELRIGGVRILNPSGFAAEAFLVLAEARVRIDLLDLLDTLRGDLHLHSIEASDVRLWFERASDGRNNWAPAQQSAPAPSRGTISVGQITLHRLAIDYHDAPTARRHFVDLDELSAGAKWNEALRLAVRGRLGTEFPFALTVEGGPLRLLQEASGPWPFTLDFASPGTRLQASGAIDASKGEAHVSFGADAAALVPAGRLPDTRLLHFSDGVLNGTLVAPADAVAELPDSTTTNELTGELTLAFGGARPRLSGALSVAALDLRPFLASGQGTPDKALDSAVLPRQMLPLRDLVPLDVDVDLSVGRWLGLPVDIRDAKFDLRADANGVRVPTSATMARAPFSGRLDLDTAAPTPTLALRFAAKDAALGDLARELHGATEIDGRLGHIELLLGGRGETLGSLLSDLELSLKAANAHLSYGKPAGARPIVVQVDTLDLALRRGQRLRGSARGTLLGEPVKLSMRGGTLPEMLGESATPIELEIVAALAKLRIEGTLARPDATRETALKFSFEARRTGDLARWLSVAPASKLPLAVRGRARIATDAWYLEQTRLKLGRSELTIDAKRSRVGDRPITVASVRSPLIDVPELATLRASTSRSSDEPVFPDAADLPDADISLALQHVRLGRTDLEDVAFVGRVREARLLASALSGKVAGVPFTGLVALNLRGDVPEARLDLSTGEIDVGALLRDIGAAEDIDGRADKLQLTLRGRGKTLRELARLSSFEARVTGGRLSVLGVLQRPVTEFGVTEARIGALPGEPIRVALNGTLDETALDIRLSSGRLVDMLRDATHLPFSLVAQAAGARLTLEGEVALPLGRSGQITFEMSGERLDSLSELARVELPAWGPWSLRGPLRMTPTGYELQGLLLSVGENRLEGTGTLDMSGARPRLDVRVNAPSIQLDDFPLPERIAEDPPRASRAEALRLTASKVVGQTERLLGAGFLRRLDAYLDLEVQEVLSGSDRLADGSLRIQVVDGRLFLGPAMVNIPGGTLRLAVAYDPTLSEIELAAGAYVERFDYGIIARRLSRKDDTRGLFSMNLEFAGRAPSLNTIMHHANGRVDFAVWPTELRTGIFSLWSVNLVLSLVPLIDPGGDAHLNCVVGRFDLKDGKLPDDKMIIDTTRVRIRGTGSADLASEKLAFVFRPRAKGFAPFRLQTPLRASGTFTDFRFGIKRRDLLESILRLIASPILLPIEWLTLGPLPRDGADVCTNPLRAIDRER
jgi:uncharacterized protein involved in outer membrane biogenesis